MSETRLDQQMVAKLVNRAKQVRENAYAPYSHFPVGVALLLADGSIVTGANVENASYSLGVCAERVAIASAVANGQRDFVALAVVSSSLPPAAPCGSCRQVISEFSQDLPLILANERGEFIQTDLGKIFPLQFSKEHLVSAKGADFDKSGD